jgi:hypothetical protein
MLQADLFISPVEHFMDVLDVDLLLDQKMKLAAYIV